MTEIRTTEIKIIGADTFYIHYTAIMGRSISLNSSDTSGVTRGVFLLE